MTVPSSTEQTPSGSYSRWERLSLHSGLLIFLLAITALLPFSFLDFDQHHEGALLPAAITVRDGGSLFADAAMQYGPLNSWLQGAWLGFWPWGEAVGLRILNTLLISISAALIAEVGRIAPKSWGLKRWPSFVAAGLWILTSDAFYGTTMLPWPTVLANLLILLVIFGAGLGAQYSSLTARGILVVFVTGFLAASVFWARQQAGLVLWLGLLTLAIFMLVTHKIKVQTVLIAGAGFVIANGSYVAGLVGSSSLNDWWSQSIVWPLKWAGAEFQGSALETILKTTINSGPFLIGALALIALGTRFPRTRSALGFLASLLLSSAMLAVYADPIVIGISHGFGEAMRNPGTSILLEINVRFLQLLIVACFIAFLTTSFRVAKTLYRRTDISERIHADLLLLAGSLSAFSQMVPVFDTRHIWWALPIPLSLLIREIGNFRKAKLVSVALVLPLSIWLTALTLTASANLFLVERLPYPSNTIAQGLSGREGNVDRLSNDLEIFDLVSNETPVIFFAHDGHFSALRGSNLSSDPYFFDWGFTPSFASRLHPGLQVIIDNDRFELYAAEFSAYEYETIRGLNITLVTIGGSLDSLTSAR